MNDEIGVLTRGYKINAGDMEVTAQEQPKATVNDIQSIAVKVT